MTRKFIIVLPFLIAITAAAQEGAKIQLSLSRATEIATSPNGNAALQMAAEAVRQAQSRSAEERAAFLPDIEGGANEASVISSLGALGLSAIPLPFGLRIPEIIGPYDVIDIRASGTETLSFSAIRRYQAARAAVRAARSERDNASDTVAASVARTYMQALRADAEAEAARADVTLAEAVEKQAENQKSAGTGTGIEVTRAKVQLSNERQRELVAENERRKARLQLLREIGMPLETEIELTSKFNGSPLPAMTVPEALAKAMLSRADLKAQRGHEEAARLVSSAAKWDRLPTITGFGNYGTTGQGPGTPTLPTREMGVALKVPIFDGGLRDARRGEMASQYRAEELRTKDLRQQIELELREALDGVHAAEEEMRVSGEGLSLAEGELTQARRRYTEGVTTSIEVADAQTRMERARSNQIAALFNYNLARVDLGQAMGAVQEMIE